MRKYLHTVFFLSLGYFIIIIFCKLVSVGISLHRCVACFITLMFRQHRTDAGVIQIQLASLVPVGHDADAVHGVILMRREGARDAVSVQILVPLQAGARRLNPGAWATLTAQRLMGDRTLVHGVSVGQLRRGVTRHAA